MQKYFVLENYINYYDRNGGLKGMAIKLANSIISFALRLVRLDRILIKVLRIVLSSIRVDEARIRQCSFAKWYTNYKYRRSYVNHPRKYIPYGLGVEAFFRELNQREIKYVVLRWFDLLPDINSSDDIDLLIADEDIDRIFDLFSTKPEGIALDAYTVRGSKGCTYGEAGSYYPADFSRRIIDNRKLYNGKYYIPDETDYKLSFLYHITYHKAEACGLRRDDHEPQANERVTKYTEEIKRCCSGLITNVTLERLHEMFIEKGYAPSIDRLRKLYLENRSEFLYRLSAGLEGSHSNQFDLVVFIIREWAFKNGEVLSIIDLIGEYDFDIVAYHYITEGEPVSELIRGGDWSKGPFMKSGGEPRLAIAAYDYHPKWLTNRRVSHPFVKNENVYIKHTIRERINSKRLITEWANFIHSSDDYIEAVEYMEAISSAMCIDTLTEIDKLSQEYSTSDMVLKRLSSSNTRSKVELIQRDESVLVKKTFKRGRERFLLREAFAYEKLSEHIPYIPKLVERGSNYVIIPFYSNILDSAGESDFRDMLISTKKQIIDFMYLLYQHGYAFVNFNPENILITEAGDLIVVDFEFLYKYKERPMKFEDCYDMAGLPSDFDGDLPKWGNPRGHSYQNTWERYLGPYSPYNN